MARKPPWWRYFEPPRWWPGWAHLLTCTHCRALSRHAAEQQRHLRWQEAWRG